MELLGGKKKLEENMRRLSILAGTHLTGKDIPFPHFISRNVLMLESLGKILQAFEGCA